MAQTHYNEISNDGRTLYAATRSTRQIEEGPVGYSVINLDAGVVSWRFVEMGNLPAVMITSPSDERLLTQSSQAQQRAVRISAKFCGDLEAVKAIATLGGVAVLMKRVPDSHVWEASLTTTREGVHTLLV